MRVNDSQLTEIEKEWLRQCLEFIDAFNGNCSVERLRTFIVRASGRSWQSNRMYNYMIDNNIIMLLDNDRVCSVKNVIDDLLGENND